MSSAVTKMAIVSEQHLSESPFLLSTMPAGRSEFYLAGSAILALIIALIVAAPYAREPLEGSSLLLPAYAAAVLVAELITAALLLALFSVQRSLAILILASGYLCSALLVVPWVLTFPGVFAPTGLLQSGLQSTATIAAVRRIEFPLLVVVYAFLNRPARDVYLDRFGSREMIFGTILALIVLAIAITLISLELSDALPTFMSDSRHVAETWDYVPALALFLQILAIMLLFTGRRSVLDIWLMVVICTVIVEVLLLSYLSAGRLSVGWWAGRLCGLASASVVLVVLLSETARLYGRLLRSHLAERRIREAQLVGMEALAASIAHEVNQPLASMVTNAAAGLRWIEREGGDLKQTKAALKRIVDDGDRAGMIIEATRSMFRKGARDRRRVSLNDIVLNALERARLDLRSGRISVRTELDRHLPSVTCNAMQMQQVVFNLIANAVDGMARTPESERVLTITSSFSHPGDALVRIGDTGSGIALTDKERIFEPFFTTKPNGMGMGLMFCRSVIEGHGGRLWATDNQPRGAVFHFTLPANDEDPSTMEQPS